MTSESTTYSLLDILIVGAGPAGLNAALVLGRMRRSVLVLDTDEPAHAVSDAVHGFLAQDGTPPRELRRTGREQLRPYSSVEREMVAARMAGGVLTADSSSTSTRAVRSRGGASCSHTGCATGFPCAGLASLWAPAVPLPLLPRLGGAGRSAGRVRRQRAGGAPGRAADLAERRRGALPSTGRRARRRPGRIARGARRRRTNEHVERVDMRGRGARRAGGAGTDRKGRVFIQPALSLASDLAPTLGAELSDAGTIAVDPAGETTIPGLYAAGDAATRAVGRRRRWERRPGRICSQCVAGHRAGRPPLQLGGHHGVRQPCHEH